MTWTMQNALIRLVDSGSKNREPNMYAHFVVPALTEDACAPSSQRWTVQWDADDPSVTTTYAWWQVVGPDDDETTAQVKLDRAREIRAATEALEAAQRELQRLTT